MNLTDISSKELLDIIINAKSTQLDKSGFSPLLVLAHEIAGLEPKEKLRLEKETADLVWYFGDFFDMDFVYLASFIYYSKFRGSRLIKDAYYEWYKGQNSDGKAGQKFLILQIISSLGFRIEMDDLFHDEYKERFFWQWILLVINNQNIDDGMPALLERVRNYQDEFFDLLKILPTMLNRLGKKKFIEVISDVYENVLAKSNQKALKEWCEKRAVEIDNHVHKGDELFLIGRAL